jgi:putative CocE/NonD family hydrolase
MRDGVALRADLYLPDGSAPAPAVVCRTPYDRGFSLTPVAALDPERATDAGLGLVIQDVRGQHGSEGEFNPFVNEGADGYDTVEWVAAQDWCDGAVGMTGRSYPAATQWRAAVERPPHLRAIVPVVVGSDYYDGWVYQGGAFQLGFNLFWVNLMTDPKARGSLAKDYRHLPITEPPLLERSPAGRFYREWLEHPTYDDHWRSLSMRGRHGEVAVPAFIVGGGFDIFLGGTLENFSRMTAEGGSDAAREGTRLLVGPWGHGSAFGAYPDHRFDGFGPDAEIDLAEEQLEFFHAHLRDRGAGSNEAPVRIFVMGRNRWRDEEGWPLARARSERWFLRHGGELSREAPGGEQPDEYDYDPADPAPTIGGPTSLPGRMMRPSAGPLDQAPAERRPDVLVYSSPPLERPLEVTGPLELVLHAATSAPDTDFVGKLCDVDGEGRSRILAEGVLRARYREGFAQPRPVEPGRPCEYRIDLVATSNVFAAGHRIRLDVTSSSFPRFDRNANSGLAPGADTKETLRSARQRIFHDARRASHLNLPVVPR